MTYPGTIVSILIDKSQHCKNVFEKCSKTLIMSATILNHKAFCRSVGLSPDEVKFIQVQSDFPVEKRSIYPLNIAYLNYNNLQSAEVKSSIARAVDNIMSMHRNDKGIIHTTSYEQLNFIKENMSEANARRLLVTDPEIQAYVLVLAINPVLILQTLSKKLKIQILTGY
jgi:ATP-dependent DNA helicase DinG